MNNFPIQSHLRSLSGYGQLGATPEINPVGTPGAAAADGGPSFKDLLSESIAKVNTQMVDSDQAVEDLAQGKSGDVHQTLIALQKADISFKMLLEVRSKVLKEYEDVMRMQA